MKKIISGFSPTLFFIVFVLGVSTVNSQLTLRKALDYDGDGKADPAVYRPLGNYWFADTSRSGAGVTSIPLGDMTLDTPAPGDYDNDGKGDLAVWRESAGAFYYLQSSNNTFVSISFGQANGEPVARDYDGDGRTDCAVVRRSGGYLLWYIRQSNGVIQGYYYGVDTDFPAPGDYDGDGKFDKAVQRKLPGNPQSLAIYASLSNSGNGMAELWGYGTDLFVPGDYDGDGITDLAIARYKDGSGNTLPNYLWYIRLSSNGSIQANTFGDIRLADIPVQADYDGDGKTDIAVWRRTDFTFYIVQSLNGQPLGFSWGTAGDFPVANYDTH